MLTHSEKSHSLYAIYTSFYSIFKFRCTKSALEFNFLSMFNRVNGYSKNILTSLVVKTRNYELDIIGFQNLF